MKSKLLGNGIMLQLAFLQVGRGQAATPPIPIENYETYWQEADDGYGREYAPVYATVVEIPVRASVNEWGGALIDVPIELPDVGSGLKPEVAFSYNSNRAEHMFGNDWRLSGLSEIEQIDKSLYYDGVSQPVDKDRAIDGNEAFALDGCRLIVKENRFPASVSYQSETGYIKVEAHFMPSDENSSGYVYSHFDVRYPDGKTGTFGFGQNSGHDADGYFPITQLTDPLGNVIHYEYQFSCGTYRISSIDFGYDREASVRFSYGKTQVCFRKGDVYADNVLTGERTFERTDSLFVTADCVLNRVEVVKDDKCFRDYTFVYSSNGQYLFLTEIHMAVPKPDYALRRTSGLTQAGDTVSGEDLIQRHDTAYYAMPLRFRYGTNGSSSAFDKTTEPWNTGYTSGFWAKKGLFGKAGTTGVVVYPKSDLYNGNPCAETASILIRPDIEETETYAIQAGKGFAELFCLDISEEHAGYEIVRVNNYRSGQRDVVELTAYALDEEAGQMEVLYTRTCSTGFPVLAGASQDDEMEEKQFYIGNFDGSGRKELFAVSSLIYETFEPFVEIYNLEADCRYEDDFGFVYDECNQPIYTGHLLSGFSVKEKRYTFSKLGVARRYVVPGDYDGDGQTELFYRPTQNQYAALFEYDPDDLVWKKMGADIDLAEASDFLHYYPKGDFNGDGRSDLYGEGSTFLLSNGQELVRHQWGSLVGGSAFSSEDLNGDGQDDFTIMHASGGETYFFAGGRMVAKSLVSDIPSGFALATYDEREAELGKEELVLVGPGELVRLSYGVDLSQELLITGVKSSMDVETTFAYKKLDDAGVYTLTSEAEYPYQNVSSRASVVAGMRKRLQGQVIEAKDYRYENGILHKQGLGFCGFGKIAVTDSLRNQTTVCTFDPYRFGVLQQAESPVQTVSNTYNVSVAADKTAVITLKNAVQADKLKGTSVTTSYLYDNYGQPVQATVDYGNGVKRVTDYRYRNTDTEARYQLGLLISQTDYSYQGNEYTSRSTTLTRNTAGLVENTRSYYNGLLVSEESTPRDGNGWVQSRTVEQYGSGRQLTTTYQYDDWGRVTQETGPTGLTMRRLYGDDGLLAASVDVRGDTTRYEYDAFGRLVKTTVPTGAVTEVHRRWANLPDSCVTDEVPDPPADALYIVRTTSYGIENRELIGVGGPSRTMIVDSTITSYSVSYHDALGRELRTAGLRFDGTWLKQDRQYDSRGRLWKESLPYKADAPSWWNVHSYDAYDRPTAIQYASGREDTWTYSGLSVTSRVDGATSTKTYDAAGRLAQATDGGGTITYTYRPDGQWQSVNTAGAVTTFAYDEYGRQVSITDPSAGVQQCGYDAAGNLGSQTDAEGRTITFEYDEYNRLTWREAPEMATAYYYNVYGQPDSIVSDNGTAHSFTYDAYGRVSTERETAPDGKWLEKTMGYDKATGELSSVKYETQTEEIGTESYRYANGHLTRVKMTRSRKVAVWPGDGKLPPIWGGGGILKPGNAPAIQPFSNWDIEMVEDPLSTIIWELKSEDEQGNPAQVQTGDSIVRTYAFDEYGYPHSRLAGTGAHSIYRQDYSFDPATGNLARRVNSTYTKETFEYDGMNRLTGCVSALIAGGDTGADDSQTTYAANGNITGRDGVLQYAYADPAHPYRLTGLTAGDDEVAARLPEYTATYTSFKRPATITNNRYVTAFTYNAAGERVRRTTTDLATDSVCAQYCLDGGRYEVGDRGEWLYLGGDPYTAPAVYRKEGSSWEVYYLLRDYQGSVNVITDQGGAVVAEYSYDPWGRQRDPVTLAPCAPGKEPELMFGRGYTGHEHLLEYGLIHMNARLYDPQTGRFLSPDPYVQDPANTQSYNRYAYALNNPLRYIDPSGERYVYNWLTQQYEDAYNNNDWTSWTQVHWWLSDIGGLIGPSGHASSNWVAEHDLASAYLFAMVGGLDSYLVSCGERGWNVGGYYLPDFLYTNQSTGQLRFMSPWAIGGEWGTSLCTIGMDALNHNGGWIDFLDGTSDILGVGSDIFTGLEKMTVTKGYWLGKNGKYYSSSWGGNGYTGGRGAALNVAKLYKGAGGVVSLIGGGLNVGLGIYEDSRMNGSLTIGYNTGNAAAQVSGGFLGSWGGFYIGVAWGTAISPGIGTAIGGAAGAILGGKIGSDLGEQAYRGLFY